MSTIIASAAAAPQSAVPSMAEFIGILSGTYQSIDVAPPAQKAPQTSHLVIRKA